MNKKTAITLLILSVLLIAAGSVAKRIFHLELHYLLVFHILGGISFVLGIGVFFLSREMASKE
ncbi:MAG: hypothetical protein JNN15_17660 [Blastocatellia bacterium]|nr:hypothetical protein [Blastocatellia bacterium]